MGVVINFMFIMSISYFAVYSKLSQHNISCIHVHKNDFTGPSKAFQCVCQVFYHKKVTNWWKIKFAFCLKEYLNVSCIPVIMTIVYVAIGTGYESILPECNHW